MSNLILPQTIVIALRLVTETGQSTHWHSTYKRRRLHRRTAYDYLAWQLGKAPLLPLTVTLTRIAPRELDQGNLESSFKGVQDGVADWIDGKPFIRKGVGGGQDRQPGLTWRYAQRKGKPREYKVEIHIAPGEENTDGI